MGTVQKLGMAVIGLAWLSTLVSNKNVSSSVLTAASRGTEGILSTAEGNPPS